MKDTTAAGQGREAEPQSWAQELEGPVGQTELEVRMVQPLVVDPRAELILRMAFPRLEGAQELSPGAYRTWFKASSLCH